MAECKRNLTVTVIVAVAVIAAVAIYASFDPSAHFFPRCPVYVMTGLQCPGCGAQRCLHALLCGRFEEAWHYNAMLIALAPVLLLMISAEIYRGRWPRLYRFMTSTAFVAGVLLILVAWMIVRNLFAF